MRKAFGDEGAIFHKLYAYEEPPFRASLNAGHK